MLSISTSSHCLQRNCCLSVHFRNRLRSTYRRHIKQLIKGKLTVWGDLGQSLHIQLPITLLLVLQSKPSCQSSIHNNRSYAAPIHRTRRSRLPFYYLSENRKKDFSKTRTLIIDSIIILLISLITTCFCSCRRNQA